MLSYRLPAAFHLQFDRLFETRRADGEYVGAKEYLADVGQAVDRLVGRHLPRVGRAFRETRRELAT